MGCFTWKFANDRRKKLQYDSTGYVVCPNNTYIKEECYDGYGRFGAEDIYNLVVDWNKDYLKEIFSKPLYSGWNHLKPVAEAFVDGKSEEELENLFEKVAKPCWNKKEWKRNLGIAIATYDQDNSKLPFPIKIVDKPIYNYSDLKPSLSCQ